jgi:CubicO group peptidase (beta-lactamase class C family)
MKTGGMNKTRLDRMHDVMAGHVERGAVPGMVTLVSRQKEVYVDVIGTKAVGNPDPIRRDTIFRISSMTKPITAAATMILVEECKVRLDEPVDRLLPELAHPRVLKRLDGPLDDTVPATRSITVRDLLTFRMGFGMVLGPLDKYPILQALRDQQIMIGAPKPQTPHSPDEWIRRLGMLPLMHQPGEKWMYNTSADVLGVLIARASDQPLEVFFRERLFEPLGMKDTSFSVSAEKLDRLASCYQFNSASQSLELHDGVHDSQWAQPPAFPTGRDGLVSTIDDYFAFGEMMLNQGRHGDQRVLSRPAVEIMITDHLTLTQKAAAGFFLGDNRGWGFGLSVITQRDDLSAVPGRFGWDGGYGTSWYSDPQEGLVGILMSQRLLDPQFSGIEGDFWTSAYQAIDD